MAWVECSRCGASAAKPHSARCTGKVTWRVRYRDDGGGKRTATFPTKTAAREFAKAVDVDRARGDWLDPAAGDLPFAAWAAEWWDVWSASPERSPAALESTESRLRTHVLPAFVSRPLRAVTVMAVQQWQDDLAGRRGRETVMACRSILYRIMDAARKERLVRHNPVVDVDPPRRRADPDVQLGRARPRVLTPEEAGRFLACWPAHWHGHVTTLAGTGLRVGELAGLAVARVHLLRRPPVLEVVQVRYQAGRFGSGLKPRPKSDAAVREVPLARQVAAAVAAAVPAGAARDALVFTGPGGGNRAARGTRTVISRDNLRRAYQRAAARAGLGHLDLSGPHDLRHTFATWLEDAGIPARVIDELMGHATGRADGAQVGRRYRHTTPEQTARVLAALEERLDVMLAVAGGAGERGRAAGVT